jgi:ATP phosphoribosyltransferase
MKAAGLKAIDTVVSSTAVLIKSRNTTNEKLVSLIAARIRGVISAFPFPPPIPGRFPYL